MLNKVMLIGNVGRDPEVRYLDVNGSQSQTNSKVASFTLATSERFRDRNGETRENTEWHNIVSWRNADLCEKFIRKGTQIYVEGRLRTREYTDQTGTKKYRTEVVADTIQLLGRKSDNPAAAQGGYSAPAQGFGGSPQGGYPSYQQSAPSPAPAPAPQAPISIDITDGPSDDLPF